MHLHLAEAAREGNLGRGRQGLVPKQQQLMLEESGIERREYAIVDVRDLRIENLRSEPALERTQVQRGAGRGYRTRCLHGCLSRPERLSEAARAGQTKVGRWNHVFGFSPSFRFT